MADALEKLSANGAARGGRGQAKVSWRTGLARVGVVARALLAGGGKAGPPAAGPNRG